MNLDAKSPEQRLSKSNPEIIKKDLTQDQNVIYPRNAMLT